MSDGSIIATVLNQGIIVFEKKDEIYAPFTISEINYKKLSGLSV